MIIAGEKKSEQSQNEAEFEIGVKNVDQHWRCVPIFIVCLTGAFNQNVTKLWGSLSTIITLKCEIPTSL